MGNHFICMPKKDGKEVGSRNKRQSRSQSKIDEEFLHRQALAMAIHQQQISQRFEGSMSRRIGSTSSRRQNIPDSVLNVNKILENIDVIETKIFVLIHGEGFGAWCWYKSMALLEESGLIPIAIDLTGSGIDHTDPNSITTLEDYSKPLINYLEKLPENVKVILVGHSCGGASVSYALEQYPEKISKAIFVGATMMSSGQRPFDVFAEELGSAQIFMQQSPFLVYANGKDKAPTSLKLGKQQLMGLYFNQTTSKDIALATVSMRPIPLAPIMESLLLSSEKFGISRRFFIQTLEDHILSPDVQEKLVRENPPEGVYKIKGSDHCPFFSKPQSLHKIFLEIAQIP